MPKKIVRLKNPDNHPHARVFRDPESGFPRSVRTGQEFASDDPLVKAYPDEFWSDADREAAEQEVEQATAAPGEKRSTRRKASEEE